ncbi:udp-glycosyltransferase 79b11 [Quercus suber]|uniref:Udp-glycosyltransferase 79b11 n=1 Tax=Quercus suber TaxID=58331 RepID=A0AAW0IUC7_QUESU
MSTKLHVAMFPWFAFGHFIPYLHLSNKLAERGHGVSFIVPKGAQSKLQHLNHYPNFINFYPLLIPHVDGLPFGAETASNVPLPLHMHPAIALDQTQHQVETILTTLKPDFIFFDFSHWMPLLAHQFGTKAILYSVVSLATLSFLMVPAKKIVKYSTNEELVQPPSGYPSTKEPVSRIDGCATIEEALPEGFEERVKGRGWVYRGWVPQTLMLKHKFVGCFVTHYGHGSMWESLLSNCQIVCVPYLLSDHILSARLMVEELNVAVEVEREDNGWISKESLSHSIISVMDKDSEVARFMKYNHAKLKEVPTNEKLSITE